MQSPCEKHWLRQGIYIQEDDGGREAFDYRIFHRFCSATCRKLGMSPHWGFHSGHAQTQLYPIKNKEKFFFYKPLVSFA